MVSPKGIERRIIPLNTFRKKRMRNKMSFGIYGQLVDLHMLNDQKFSTRRLMAIKGIIRCLSNKRE